MKGLKKVYSSSSGWADFLARPVILKLTCLIGNWVKGSHLSTKSIIKQASTFTCCCPDKQNKCESCLPKLRISRNSRFFSSPECVQGFFAKPLTVWCAFVVRCWMNFKRRELILTWGFVLIFVRGPVRFYCFASGLDFILTCKQNRQELWSSRKGMRKIIRINFLSLQSPRNIIFGNKSI